MQAERPSEDDAARRLERAAGLEEPAHLTQVDGGVGQSCRVLGREAEGEELRTTPAAYERPFRKPLPNGLGGLPHGSVWAVPALLGDRRRA